MPFNVEAFERAEFQPRTARVQVPDLAPFFSADEPREWVVRGLTGAELFRANDAADRQKKAGTLAEAIGVGAEAIAAIKKALGLSNDTPPELAKRLEMLVAGSVSPKVELPIAVKLAEHFPIEFSILTREITNLTGMGADLVKPAAASQENQA